MMTRGIDDEKLMAYVDGELGAVERAEVEALLARDSSLQERAEMFRQSADLARLALADTLREPVPDAMLAKLQATEHDGLLKRLFRRFGGAGRQWSLPLGGLELATAAGLLLVVGGVVGTQLGGDAVYSDAMDPRVADALSTAGSGMVVVLDGSDGTEDVLPLLTYVNADGHYCRHYLHHGAGPQGGQTVDGVACLDGGGNWQQVITVRLDASEVEGDGYVTASGGESVLVDDFIESTIAGAPIVGPDEAELIGSDWSADDSS